ncbi:hypothetical protein VRK_15960 [Vibrio sp. MEBiC08052]|nr:hypothetical protein VRK_15960 [Vibrio sp. MEBiC08052]
MNTDDDRLRRNCAPRKTDQVIISGMFFCPVMMTIPKL